MLPERRGVVFDLDDTIYPFRRWLASGFAAVADHLADSHGEDGRALLRVMLLARRSRARGRELQVCLAAAGLPSDLLPPLRRILDDHTPSLRLPSSTRRALERLRADYWRLGVLTNGPTGRQARRVAALGLAPFVDAIVYATEHGSGAGKPDPEPFAAVARQLGVAPTHLVFVGDDDRCDLRGAQAAGMSAIRCAVWRPADTTVPDCPVLHRMHDLPDLVRHTLQEVVRRDAA